MAVNGIGYNPQDNFIYGWVGAKLYQIDSTGVFTDTGVSVTGVNPSGGDILRAIRAAVKGKKNIVVTVSGWVKETGDKSYDAKLSSARAANMVYMLKSIWHVKATYSYKGYGISPENSAKSRRADIVVTYTKQLSNELGSARNRRAYFVKWPSLSTE